MLVISSFYGFLFVFLFFSPKDGEATDTLRANGLNSKNTAIFSIKFPYYYFSHFIIGILQILGKIMPE